MVTTQGPEEKLFYCGGLIGLILWTFLPKSGPWKNFLFLRDYYNVLEVLVNKKENERFETLFDWEGRGCQVFRVLSQQKDRRYLEEYQKYLRAIFETEKATFVRYQSLHASSVLSKLKAIEATPTWQAAILS